MPIPISTSATTNNAAATSDDDDSLYNERPSTAMADFPPISETILDSLDGIDSILDAEDEQLESENDDDNNNGNHSENANENLENDVNNHNNNNLTSSVNSNPTSSSSSLEGAVANGNGAHHPNFRYRSHSPHHSDSNSNSLTDPSSPPPSLPRLLRIPAYQAPHVLQGGHMDPHVELGMSNNTFQQLDAFTDVVIENEDPPSDDRNEDSMVEVTLTPRGDATSLRPPPLTIDDDRFDSDEHVDVESLSTSDDELEHPRLRASSVPSEQPSTGGMATIDTEKTTAASSMDMPTHASSKLPLPYSAHDNDKKPSQPSGISLLSRASHTFYKTFIGRKTSSSDNSKHSTNKDKSSTSNTSKNLSSSTNNNNRGNAMTKVAVTNDDRYERLCRLLDAQLSALDGAKTGFVQLDLLQPLAEQTLRAVSEDARSLLGEYGELEERAEIRQREAAEATEKGEEEIIRKEQLLIEAKVALAEACGEVERLRGELAATNRKLANPATMEKRLKKERDTVRKETELCVDTRLAVEKKLVERRESLGKEKAELGRLEKEFRDIEGDWA